RLVAVEAWHAAPAPVEKNGKLVAPQNPYLAEPISARWPHDPLGHRRDVLGSLPRRLGELVAAGPIDLAGDPRADDLRLLLAEQAMKGVRDEPVVDVPRHLSASAVVAL